MDITWLGHSCFRIKGKETTVVTDPCHPDIGYASVKLQANVVTVSHAHPGHSYVECLCGEGRVLRKPGEYEVRDVMVVGWGAFHDAKEGIERGKNTVFMMEVDGVTLCHLGDIGHLPAAELMREISNVDILFLPVGGVSTVPIPVAAEIMRHVAPKVVIPMHYKTACLKVELEPLDKFLKEAGTGEKAPQPKFSVNKNTLPQTTQIVVLSYPQK